MKKTFTLFAFALSVGVVVKYTNLQAKPSSTPSGGYSGAPASNLTCQAGGCHSGSTTADATQFILQMDTLQSGLSSGVVTSATTYIPGKTYYMALQLTGTGSRYGFELSSLNGSNAQAGTFTVTNTTSTTIVNGPSTSVKCMSHKNAGTTKSWIWQWTAPTTAQDVTFWYDGMLANGNGNEAGDICYKSSSTITAYVAPNSIESLSGIAQLGMYPTQTMAEFAMNIELKETLHTTIQVVDLKGSVVRTLFEGNLNEGSNQVRYDVSDLEKGSYLVNVSTAKGSVTKHLIKL